MLDCAQIEITTEYNILVYVLPEVSTREYNILYVITIYILVCARLKN